MKNTPWFVVGALSVGSLVAGACSSDDSGDSGGPTGGTTNTTATSTTGTTGATGSSTTSTSTTGASGTSTTGASGTTGTGGATSTSSSTGAAGAAGAPPEIPTCEEIPTRAFVKDGVEADGFSVSSDDFASCMPLPEASTCDGALFASGVSPAVTWTAGPTGTLSYAVTFTDITILAVRDPAVNMTYNQGYHYVLWDIPADVLGIPAELGDGFEPAEIPGAKQWAPFNNYAFMGPCPNMPPPTDGSEPPPLNNDSYSFTVYAMDVATLPVPALEADGPSFPRVMDDYLKEHA